MKTSHNKNKRYINCKECGRKRYCSREPIPNYNFRWTCSKGHSWIEVGITLGRVQAMMEEVFTRDSFKNLSERDNPFYARLKK